MQAIDRAYLFRMMELMMELMNITFVESGVLQVLKVSTVFITH